MSPDLTTRVAGDASALDRRRFLFRAGGGFLGVALGGLWAEAGEIPDAILGPHFRPRARSVIFLFMCGGVSHIDTFDPKGNAHAGRLIDAIGFGDNLAAMRRPVIPCHRTFTRHGRSGTPVSDWFPHVGGVVDEIAVVRSMWCHEGNHFPAGHRDLHRPSRPGLRPSVVRRLGLARAGLGQPQPADLRQHRPTLVAGATHRRLSWAGRLGHPVPGGPDPGAEPASFRRSLRARA